jgi:glucose-1-phosphate thymidylyltransferase
MNVIIPVAGKGKRLRPHTNAMPKPLLKVAGATILDHVLRPILPLKPQLVTFVIGHMGAMVRKHVRDTYDFESRFVEQDKLLGLGYAVRAGLEGLSDGPLLIVLGDTIVQTNLLSLLKNEHHVLGVRKVEDPCRFGVAEVSDGHITHLEEKPSEPKSNLALVGLYYFTDAAPLRQALDRLIDSGKRTRDEVQLTDALEMMVIDGHKFVPLEVRNWFDCGKKETMLESNRHLLARMDAAPKVAGSTIIPPVLLPPTAVVTDCTLGPNVSVADGCRLTRCTIENSVLAENVTAENSKIRDSLIGPGAIIRGGDGVFSIGERAEVDLT